MTKVDAVKYILKNMNDADKTLLFKESLDLKTLRQFVVGLEWEYLDIVKSTLGERFFSMLLDDIELNKGLVTEMGFSVAVSVIIAEFESLQEAGAIQFSFPENEETTAEANLARVESWIKAVRAK